MSKIHEFKSKPTIVIKVGERFRCPCGTLMPETDGWVAAHWDEPLRVQCNECGRTFHMMDGRVTTSREIED